ncbi:hypothetical protein ACX0HA_02405 [Flavobacterium hauense]
MDTIATYTAWITIKITHDYFIKDRNCITIVPTRETHKALTRAGIIIKQTDSCTWLLLKEESLNEIIEEDLIGAMDFCLMNTDAGFYYYTDNNVAEGKPVWELAAVGKNGIWKTLTVNIDRTLLQQKETTVNIVISSPKKFMEFLIIAKSGNRPPLTMREDNGKLVFKHSDVDFPGEPQPVYRFVTDKPVALKEVYNYSIQLWEIKESGESLLSNNIPFPKTTAASMINSQNTISSYFYF